MTGLKANFQPNSLMQFVNETSSCQTGSFRITSVTRIWGDLKFAGTATSTRAASITRPTNGGPPCAIAGTRIQLAISMVCHSLLNSIIGIGMERTESFSHKICCKPMQWPCFKSITDVQYSSTNVLKMSVLKVILYHHKSFKLG